MDLRYLGQGQAETSGCVNEPEDSPQKQPLGCALTKAIKGAEDKGDDVR